MRQLPSFWNRSARQFAVHGSKKLLRKRLVPTRTLSCESLELRTLLSTFYVAAEGNDSYDGLAATYDGSHGPWQTLGKVNQTTLAPGDTVLFKRGGEYRDNVNVIKQSGDSTGRITYGDYGDPNLPKPIIVGSAERNFVDDWTETTPGSHIWTTSSPLDSISAAGSTEMVSNGSFDNNNLSGWYSWYGDGGSGTMSAVNNYLDAHCNNPGSSGYCFQVFTNVSIVEGNYYLLSFKAKASTPFTVPAVRFEWGSSMGIALDSSDGAAPAVTTDWKTYTILFKATETGTTKVMFYLGGSSGMPSGSDFYLDDVSLKKCSTTNNERLLDAAVGSLIFNNGEGEWCGFRRYSPTALVEQGDYYFDSGTGAVTLYSTSNPATFYDDIEIALSDPIVDTGSYTNYENIDFRYGGLHGLWYVGTSYCTVTNCDVAYIGGCGSESDRQGNAFELYFSDTNILVEGCTVHDVYDVAFGVESRGGLGMADVTFQNNVTWNCEWGCELDTEGGGTVEDVNFINNTFAYNGYGKFAEEDRSLDADPRGVGIKITNGFVLVTSASFCNNIVYEATDECLLNYNFPLDNITLDNNVYYQSDLSRMVAMHWDPSGLHLLPHDGYHYMMPGYTLGNWWEIPFEGNWFTDTGRDEHSIVADPLFVDPANGDFHLRSGSPAINAGANTGIGTDFDGTSRPQGSGYDIGAYEYQAAPTVALAKATYLPGHVVNIDFNGYRAGDTLGLTYTGSDGLSGGSSSVWNGLVADSLDYGDMLTISRSNLCDAAGNTTTMNISVTPVGGDNLGTGGDTSQPAALLKDYIFCNSAGNVNQNPTVTISGLGANATVDIYIYTYVTSQSTATISFGGVTGVQGVNNTTLYFANVPVAGGTATGHMATDSSTTNLIYGMSVVTPVPAQLDVVNIDFNGYRAGDTLGLTYTASDGLSGGASSVWNGLVADSLDYGDMLTVSGSNLHDAAGNTTSISFNVTPVGGDNLGTGSDPSQPVALLNDYIFCNSAGNVGQNPTFTISGLSTHATVDIYAYTYVTGQSIATISFGGVTGVQGVNNTTLYFANVPVVNGTVTGHMATDSASCNVLYGISIVPDKSNVVFVAPGVATSVALTTTAADSDGTISNVAFYQGSTFIADGTLNNGYYTATCTVPAWSYGSYVITAKATDNQGLTTTSTALNLTIAGWPTNQAVDSGQTATFKVASPVGASLLSSYQWQKYNTSTSSWDDISGATGPYYTTAATTSADDGALYRVVVSNGGDSVTSPSATLYVNYGLEGWWKLDESTGTSVADASGNSHTGTRVNGGTWGATGGLINGALTFDGTDSYVSVPSTTALKYTGGEMTLDTWVYVNTTDTNGAYLISKPWNAVGDGYNYQLGFNSGSSSTTGTLFFTVQGSGSAYTITSTSGISTAAWHAIAATVDSTGAMCLYVDGVLVASGTNSITSWTPMTDGNKALVIGSKWTYAAGSYGSSTLSGKMDNVQVYTHTLSAEAIAEKALAAIGYWKLNDASGSTAADSSGNSYSGTLTNGATWSTTGEYDDAITFDGVDSYVSVTSTTALKYKGAELTLATWVNVNSAEADGGYLISKPWNTVSGQYNYRLGLNSSRQITFYLQGTTTSYMLTTTATLAAGEWHHVAATVNASKAVCIYIDGVLVASGTHTITAWAPTDSSKPLVIGSMYNYAAGSYSAYSFKGQLDNVRVYDQTLTLNEVKWLAIDPPPTSGSGVLRSTAVSTYSVSTIEPAIGKLPTYAILAGQAFLPSASILADVMPSVRQVSSLADRVDAVLRDATYVPANKVFGPARSRVDAALATVDAEKSPLFSDDQIERVLDGLSLQGLKNTKVLSAVDACFWR